MIIPQHTYHKNWLGILASIFLGMIFIVAGSGKLFSGVVDFQLITLAGAFNTWLIIATVVLAKDKSEVILNVASRPEEVESIFNELETILLTKKTE